MSGGRAPPPGGLRVLVAGGGVAGLEALLALRALAGDRVDLELLSEEPFVWYRPLAVGEPFGLARAEHVDLTAVTSRVDARSSLGRVDAVDHERRVVRTAAGSVIPYDALVLALGARPEPALVGASLVFRGPADTEAYGRLLAELGRGEARRLVLAVPEGPVWPLPIYELALLTAGTLGGRVEIALVTPETRPLEAFGPDAGDEVERLLAERGVALHAERTPTFAADGELRLAPAGAIAYDRLVAAPRLQGQAPRGVPQDRHGFVPTDAYGRVEGCAGVFAAGDVVASPVKLGAVAAGQADAVARWIAAEAGAAVVPEPYRPVLPPPPLLLGPPEPGRHVAKRKLPARHLGPVLAELAAQASRDQR